MSLWIELAVLLLCLAIGARLGGIALGTISGLGLVLFVFLFHLPPGGPPGTVLGMIIAVITAVSAMEAAGGLDFLVGTAGRIMTGRPRQITFVAPLVTYLLVFASGTQHVVYALLPVIAEVARKAGIRPERPLSASVVAAQCGVIASPIAAATVALAGLLAGANISLPKILLVTIPATLTGMLLGTLSVAFRGKELADDPEYQLRSADRVSAAESEPPPPERAAQRRASGSCLVFLAAIVVVILIGLIPGARPVYKGSQTT